MVWDRAEAKGIWSKVTKSREGDTWYVDQTLGYENKHGKVTVSRAYLKCVPGKDSVLGEEVREFLDSSGVAPAGFSYFVGSVAIDCRRRLLRFAEITYFDGDDRALFRKDYDESEHFTGTADHSSEDISHYLCLDKSGFLDTLKKQEPFLYLFPQ